jgi:hypothetical protein
MKAPSWLAVGVIALCVCSAVAQTSSNVSIFATGFNDPRGLKWGPDGNLYVAEAGNGGPVSTVGHACRFPVLLARGLAVGTPAFPESPQTELVPLWSTISPLPGPQSEILWASLTSPSSARRCLPLPLVEAVLTVTPTPRTPSSRSILTDRGRGSQTLAHFRNFTPQKRSSLGILNPAHRHSPIAAHF